LNTSTAKNKKEERGKKEGSKEGREGERKEGREGRREGQALAAAVCKQLQGIYGKTGVVTVGALLIIALPGLPTLE
jgi:hypothetical protein